MYLDGNTNYKIVDNDLLATAIVIHTGGHGLHQGGAARYGLIARNMIWNANAAHWFDDIKEVIFEVIAVRSVPSYTVHRALFDRRGACACTLAG
eukprot:COSAG05_NODE_768_length_7455_cov_4.609027_10_plen_94_part_00